VPGWVTVFGQVNHLGAEPETQAYSAWARPLWLGWNEYHAKAGGVNRHIAWYTTPYPYSRSVRWCLAGGLACGDQRRRTGSGSALEELRDDALHKYTYPFSRSVRWCLAGGLACGDQRRRTGSGSALEELRGDALHKYTFTSLYCDVEYLRNDTTRQTHILTINVKKLP